MTSAIAGMTIFGWVTQEFGERPSVFGIGWVCFIGGGVRRVARWVQVNWSETSVPAEEAARSVGCGDAAHKSLSPHPYHGRLHGSRGPVQRRSEQQAGIGEV